jgi:RNA polymerase sigma-70 factor (ECF subfamily)
VAVSTTQRQGPALDEPAADPVLAAARAGDGGAFRVLVGPHLRALHVHSYRMLGSYADAEEAVQEATLRAWRGLGGYQGTGPLRHWLYRITTTTCLKMINKRGRDPLASTAEAAWLQPYPDALLDELPADDADPAAIVDRRESVALAFVAALQLLPATQRAVLILREVLGWSAVTSPTCSTPPWPEWTAPCNAPAPPSPPHRPPAPGTAGSAHAKGRSSTRS